MALEAPPVQRHEVHILTLHFQFSGQIETVGPVDNYINDPTHDSFSLYDARLAALAAGSPLKALSLPHVVVRKPHVVLMHFASAGVRASIHTLPRRELLVAYTPVAVCRGYFHMPHEASTRDFLGVVPGDLLPITDVHVFSLTGLPVPFPSEAEMVLIGRSHLNFYHAL